MYGILAILLPASMTAWTCGGAEAGAIARPSGPTVAMSPGPSCSGAASAAADCGTLTFKFLGSAPPVEADATAPPLTATSLITFASVRVTFAVDLAALGLFEGAHSGLRTGPELTVGADHDADAVEVLLERLDVLALVALLEGALTEGPTHFLADAWPGYE